MNKQEIENKLRELRTEHELQAKSNWKELIKIVMIKFQKNDETKNHK